MKIADSARRAGRSLRSAKGRTILTSLAIAVGAFTLTAALAAGTGARQYADKLITSNVDPQSVFVAKDETLFGGGAPGAGGLKEYSENATQFGGATFKALDQNDIETLEKIPGVEKVVPTYLVTAQYVVFEGSDTRYTTDITAYDPSVRADTAAGTLPELGTQIGERDVVLPESYVETLG
jgi:ABC-type antimicrobial peptide transport system permease subunit